MKLLLWAGFVRSIDTVLLKSVPVHYLDKLNLRSLLLTNLSCLTAGSFRVSQQREISRFFSLAYVEEDQGQTISLIKISIFIFIKYFKKEICWESYNLPSPMSGSTRSQIPVRERSFYLHFLTLFWIRSNRMTYYNLEPKSIM